MEVFYFYAGTFVQEMIVDNFMIPFSLRSPNKSFCIEDYAKVNANLYFINFLYFNYKLLYSKFKGKAVAGTAWRYKSIFRNLWHRFVNSIELKEKLQRTSKT